MRHLIPYAYISCLYVMYIHSCVYVTLILHAYTWHCAAGDTALRHISHSILSTPGTAPRGIQHSGISATLY